MEDKIIFICVTDFCNLNCLHCFNRTNPQKKILKIEDIQRLIIEAKLCGLFTIYLTGGEPFTHPDMEGIITLIQRNQDVDFVINTNGTIDISSYCISELKKCRNLTLQISYDGMKTENFDKIRGEGVKEKVDRTISLLKAHCIKYALKMTISELNKNDVVEYLSYLEVNKIEGSVAFCSPFGNSSINSKILELKLQDRFNLYKSIRQFYQERGIAKKAPTSVLSCKLMSDDSLSTCVITGSGELYLCDRWKDSLLGNIHDASLKELLNPEKIEDLKKTIQKRAELIKQTHCNDCILVGVCSQGCPALSEARDGSIFSLDGECSFRKQLFLYDCMLKGYI